MKKAKAGVAVRPALSPLGKRSCRGEADLQTVKFRLSPAMDMRGDNMCGSGPPECFQQGIAMVSIQHKIPFDSMRYPIPVRFVRSVCEESGMDHPDVVPLLRLLRLPLQPVSQVRLLRQARPQEKRVEPAEADTLMEEGPATGPEHGTVESKVVRLYRHGGVWFKFVPHLVIARNNVCRKRKAIQIMLDGFQLQPVRGSVPSHIPPHQEEIRLQLQDLVPGHRPVLVPGRLEAV